MPFYVSVTEEHTNTTQYFKSIESPDLKPLHPHPPTLPQETLPPPSAEYTPAPPVPSTSLNGDGPGPSPILQPLPVSSHLRIPDTGPASRSVSPDVDLVPDRMASRIPGGGFAGRLSPQPGGVKA